MIEMVKKEIKVLVDEEPKDPQKDWNDYQRESIVLFAEILHTLRLILEEVKKPLGE